MNHDDAIGLLAVLAAAYPRQLTEQAAELGNVEETVEMWRRELVKLDAETTRRAVERWTEHEKWFPTLAEFRDYYRSTRLSMTAKEPAELRDQPVAAPEWVHVWRWATLTGRVPRDAHFPQFPRPDDDLGRTHDGWLRIVDVLGNPRTVRVVTEQDYERLVGEWREAGAPRSGSPEMEAVIEMATQAEPNPATPGGRVAASFDPAYTRDDAVAAGVDPALVSRRREP